MAIVFPSRWEPGEQDAGDHKGPPILSSTTLAPTDHRSPARQASGDAWWAAARAARTFYAEMASRDELCGHYHQFEMAIVAGAGMAEVVVAETVAEVGELGEVVGPTPVVDSVEVPVGFAFPMAAARVVVELGVVVVGIPDSRAADSKVAEVVEAAGSRTVEVVEAADSNLVETLEVEVVWQRTDLMHKRRVLCDRCECVSRYRGQSGRLEQRE